MSDAEGRPRRVAVVTGSRADYGLLRPTITRLRSDPRLDLALIVSAMHLSPRFGSTVTEIEADGFAIAARVPTQSDDDAPGALGRRIATATAGFTAALAELDPDLVLLIGDRYEMLAAAIAATGHELIVAHVHGGELSEGSLDDAIRHSITKLAHVHFVAARPYAERVCQLGEQPDRVHVVGAVGVEAARQLEPLSRAQLAESLGLDDLRAPVIVATLHPTSLEPDRAAIDAAEVTSALAELATAGATVVATLPNDDPGNVDIRRALSELAEANPAVSAHASLGQLRYLSLLARADLMVGNSSSGLIEAPAFDLPVVNVGNRQRGRLRAPHVLDCEPTSEAILAAARRGLDPDFRASLRGAPSPYGEGEASRRIVEALAELPPARELRDKRFADLPDGPWRAGLDLAEELS